MKRAVLVLLVVLLSTSPTLPAAAHPLSGHRHWGQGAHHLLGAGHLTQGNQVALWQSFILTYNQIPCTGLDGIYGPQTTQGTRNIQAFFGLTRDGIVGPNTWNAASGWLHMAGTDGFITTYWTPNFATTFYPLYRYYYGNDWAWQVPLVVEPFEVFHHSNHPGTTFTISPTCHL